MKKRYYLDLLKNITVDNNKPFNVKKGIVIEKLEKVLDGQELTPVDQIELVYCIHVSALTGKLEQFHSISSSVAENEICKARSQNCNSICSKCYAKDSVSYRSNLKLALLINHIILNCFDIDTEAWKVLPIPSTNGKARLESHGDVASVTASDNMTKIIMSHNWLVFGVWTKNHGFWKRSLDRFGKPSNMVFIVSSDIVNKVLEVPDGVRKYVDHVFTVFDFKYVKEHNVEIHCGYHHCKDCLVCYTLDSKQYYVNEILKKDTKKYCAYMGIDY